VRATAAHRQAIIRPSVEGMGSSAPETAALPRAFIQTTQSDLYRRLIAEARTAGWYCQEIGGGHYAMITEPKAVAAALNALPDQEAWLWRNRR
jgi:hypothetical protein